MTDGWSAGSYAFHVSLFLPGEFEAFLGALLILWVDPTVFEVWSLCLNRVSFTVHEVVGFQGEHHLSGLFVYALKITKEGCATVLESERKKTKAAGRSVDVLEKEAGTK